VIGKGHHDPTVVHPEFDFSVWKILVLLSRDPACCCMRLLACEQVRRKL